MTSEKSKWISIMIVPEDGAIMKKWRITTRRFAFLKTLLWAMLVFFVVGIFSMAGIVYMTLKVRQYRTVNTQLLEATTQLETIAERLDRYEQKEKTLRAIIGSDLVIPESVVVDEDAEVVTDVAPESRDGLNELELATLRREAESRRVPTMWPVDGWQVSEGMSDGDVEDAVHTGIDILAPGKSAVVAAGAGEVVFAERDLQLGQLVIIDHGNGWETRYGHLGVILVKFGDTVRKGQQIGVFGNSGTMSTGSHLHFEMSYRGQPVDPLDWLEKKPQLSVSALDR